MESRDPFRVERLDLGNKARCDAYHRFRTDYFAHALGWKVLNEQGVDRDSIDLQSSHFCLIDERDDVVGSIRVTPPTAPVWMLDLAPFSGLLDGDLDPDYPRTQSVEISRLGALPAVAGLVDRFGFSAAQALRRAAYREALRLGLRYWYVIAYRALIERLRRLDCLPFRIISPTVRLDPRGRTCIACLDLADAYVNMARRDPAFLQWNHEDVPLSELALLMERESRAASPGAPAVAVTRGRLMSAV